MSSDRRTARTILSGDRWSHSFGLKSHSFGLKSHSLGLKHHAQRFRPLWQDGEARDMKSNNDAAQGRPKAYNYVRFSTPEQAQGDSYRRQTEAAASYARIHGLELDADLTYADLGISAFTGDNARTGALAAFLAAVKVGTVPKGSRLL